MCTLVITLATCGRTSTLLSAVTVPVASSMTSTSLFWATTVVTLTGGPARARSRRTMARPAPAASEASPPACGRSNDSAAATTNRGDEPAMTRLFIRPRL